MSHVTRHTSLFTRQTSHVTRHTSHVTRHTSQCLHPLDFHLQRFAPDLASHILPLGAKEQMETIFREFRGRREASGNAAENGASTGLQNMAEFQAKPWFPAYLACLLDPLWPIPGLSVWWSERIKIFLRVRYQCFFAQFACARHVTRHTSHFTSHTSHITRHSSHVTHHTSRITRHTSKMTHHT